ncbi:MAG TPA: cell wall hydrolase [Caulobacteraceae bacterium]|nr:cell wall hydrolase [Caulobacteraceae bacterium]
MKTTPAASAAWGPSRASTYAITLPLALAAAAVALTPASQLQSFALDPFSPPAIAPASTDTNLAAAPPFYLHAATSAEAARAVRCLTDAIYYEAANQPVEGQRAIAQVVLNRVRDPHFPKSVCGVVYEGWARRTGCQFSFVCDGSIRRRHADPVAWNQLKPLAEQALNGYVVPEVGSATHYYAQYVRPNWEGTVAKITQIGAHIFCSWQGRAGFVSALDEAYQGGEFAISDAVLEGEGQPAPRQAVLTKAVSRKLVSGKTLARHRLGRVTGRLRVASSDHGDAKA